MKEKVQEKKLHECSSTRPQLILTSIL